MQRNHIHSRTASAKAEAELSPFPPQGKPPLGDEKLHIIAQPERGQLG